MNRTTFDIYLYLRMESKAMPTIKYPPKLDFKPWGRPNDNFSVSLLFVFLCSSFRFVSIRNYWLNNVNKNNILLRYYLIFGCFHLLLFDIFFRPLVTNVRLLLLPAWAKRHPSFVTTDEHFLYVFFLYYQINLCNHLVLSNLMSLKMPTL